MEPRLNIRTRLGWPEIREEGEGESAMKRIRQERYLSKTTRSWREKRTNECKAEYAPQGRCNPKRKTTAPYVTDQAGAKRRKNESKLSQASCFLIDLSKPWRESLKRRRRMKRKMRGAFLCRHRLLHIGV